MADAATVIQICDRIWRPIEGSILQGPITTGFELGVKWFKRGRCDTTTHVKQPIDIVIEMIPIQREISPRRAC